MTHPKNTGSRKDLFNLSAPLTRTKPASESETVQQLAGQGIRVSPAGESHWILTGKCPLPEIHCYSVWELQAMACSEARYHLIHNQREPV